MKSVIRQEWKMRKSAIFWGSGILLLLNVGIIITTAIANATLNVKMQFAANMLSTVTLIVDSFGIVLWSLFKGAGCIKSMLFSDTGYLMMLLPKKSIVLLTGKTIVGLIEFVIYAAQVCIYMLLLVPINLGQIGVQQDEISGGIIRGTSYFERLGIALKDIFGTHLIESMNIVGIAIVCFILAEIIINFSMILFAAFCKNRKLSKLLVALFLGLLTWFTLWITSNVLNLNVINFQIYRDFMDLWKPIGIMTIPCALYYAATCLIYEKKISL